MDVTRMADHQLNRDSSSTPEQAQLIEQAAQAIAMQPPVVKQLEHALNDIYFVSGLGADERVFQLLKLEGYRPVHIRWVVPDRGESINHYAQRLTAQIQSDHPIIVGLSFGGMIAVEMAKHLQVQQVVLVSSAKTWWEIPVYFRALRWFPIHRVFPFKTLLWAGHWIADWVFSSETVDERKLLRAILWDTDPHFLKWALHQVVTWRNETIPDRLHHLHGWSDRIFPIRYVDADIVLEQAGHLMILNRATQVSAILEKLFETAEPG